MFEVFSSAVLLTIHSRPPPQSVGKQPNKYAWKTSVGVRDETLHNRSVSMKNFRQTFFSIIAGNRTQRRSFLFNLILKYFHFSLIKRWLKGFFAWRAENSVEITSALKPTISIIFQPSPCAEQTEIRNMWRWRNRHIDFLCFWVKNINQNETD